MSEVYFKIGEEFGDLIQQIAQEHLLANRFDKAINTLKNTGVPEEYIMDILLGIKCLDTDVENQELLISDRKKLIDLYSIKRRSREIDETCDILIEGFRKLTKTRLTLDWDMLYEIYSGESVRELIEDTEEYEEIENFYNVALTFIKESLEFYNTWEGIIKTIKKYFFVEFGYIYFERNPKVIKLQQLLNRQLLEEEYENDILNEYITTVQELDKIDKLDPTTELKDAGWISPEGVYYGLNGIRSANLHVQITDFLIKQEVIDSEEDLRAWIKQHDNWLLTDAYYFEKELTEAQIKKAKKLLDQKYKTVKLGLDMFEISLAMFESIDRIQFKMKFFKL